MNSAAPLVCLVTQGHLASTPRLLKEADALVGAGYRVHVVAGRFYPPVDPLDREILAAARWAHTLVDYRGGPAVFVRKLLRRAARKLVRQAPFANVALAARAHHAESLHLGAVAARLPASLYLGHCLAALPAVVNAAKTRGVSCGFDGEDFHDTETKAALGEPASVAAARILQMNLLRECEHLTAASPLIAREFEKSYGVKMTSVLNVFPRSEAPAAPVDPGPISAERPARLYWFSQTIGPGRGLDAVVAAMARMRTPVELHLRGMARPSYLTQLNDHAAKVGLARPIRYLPAGPAAEMARFAASADLGLSAEEREPQNRDLCLTNKIFTYLLAGIPQLLSATSAQTALAPELGAAALLDDLTDPARTAQLLDGFFADPARIATARRTAWELARTRFCWDVEQEIFLASVRRLAPLPSSSPP
ncbi:MAG: hypothetical protein HY302_08095 [Opitutae bacterium]|nr:hypothetical protein [Opitutae bacterium]